MIALLQLGDDRVETAGEEAKVEHPAVRQAVEQLVQPLQDDRPVDGKLVELYVNSLASIWIFTHKKLRKKSRVWSDRMYRSCRGCLMIPMLPIVGQRARQVELDIGERLIHITITHFDILESSQ